MADDEYEQERQENIRRNRELLLSLGLNPGTSHQTAVRQGSSNGPPVRRKSRKSDEEPRRSSRPKRQRRSTEPAEHYPSATRKSARLSGQQTVSYNEDDESDNMSGRIRRQSGVDTVPSDFPPAPRLKRLHNPSPPVLEDEGGMQEYDRALLPGRDSRGNILFENNNRHFMPNVTPMEMLQGGIFGGTAFRPFYSRVLKADLNPDEEMAEFPSEWFVSLDKDEKVCSEVYDPEQNRFAVKAGQSLEDWESQGWVRAQDPRGWWQWYFRFYLGRRTRDDARQIGRWLKACGPAGRFKRSLVAKIHRAGASWDDETVSPVVRQTLFHWAYQLTEHDYHAYLP